MSSQGAEGSTEQQLVQRCLTGEADALAKLRAEYLDPIQHLLVSRGVDAVLAREVIGTLWADCVVSADGGAAILEKFRGRAGLRTWLFRIALNRALDRGRSGQRNYQLMQWTRAGEGDQLILADRPAPAQASEPALAQLLRACLQAGFEACPAEDLLKLRLFFLHGLTKRELSRLWDCHETTISRDLYRSLQLIEDRTLQAIKRRDPWLSLTWEDFVGLCDAEMREFI